MMKKLIISLCLVLMGVMCGQFAWSNTLMPKEKPLAEDKPTASRKARLAHKTATKIQAKIAKKQAKRTKKDKQTKGFKMNWKWFWGWGILLPTVFSLIMYVLFAGSDLSALGLFLILYLIFLILLILIPLIISIVKKDWDIFKSAMLGFLSFYLVTLLITLLLRSGGTA